VRSYLAKQGWSGANAHPEIIWVRGAQLRKFIRACSKADLS
jgi:hypothetical protein